jgi:hypothetical protein
MQPHRRNDLDCAEHRQQSTSEGRPQSSTNIKINNGSYTENLTTSILGSRVTTHRWGEIHRNVDYAREPQ